MWFRIGSFLAERGKMSHFKWVMEKWISRPDWLRLNITQSWNTFRPSYHLRKKSQRDNCQEQKLWEIIRVILDQFFTHGFNKNMIYANRWLKSWWFLSGLHFAMMIACAWVFIRKNKFWFNEEWSTFILINDKFENIIQLDL